MQEHLTDVTNNYEQDEHYLICATETDDDFVKVDSNAKHLKALVESFFKILSQTNLSKLKKVHLMTELSVLSVNLSGDLNVYKGLNTKEILESIIADKKNVISLIKTISSYD